MLNFFKKVFSRSISKALTEIANISPQNALDSIPWKKEAPYWLQRQLILQKVNPRKRNDDGSFTMWVHPEDLRLHIILDRYKLDLTFGNIAAAAQLREEVKKNYEIDLDLPI